MIRKGILLKVLTVTVGFVVLAILVLPYPFSSSDAQLYASLEVYMSLLSFTVVFGLIAFYVGGDLPLPSLSLFMLEAALLISFVRLLDITLDGWRLAEQVSYNPPGYTGYVDSLFLRGVAPVIAGLVFVVLAFALSRKKPAGMVRVFLQLLVGTVITGLGAVFLSDAYDRYVNPSEGVWGPNADTATAMLREIYRTYVVAGTAWVLAGVSLSAIALYIVPRTYHRRPKQPTETRVQAHAELE